MENRTKENPPAVRADGPKQFNNMELQSDDVIAAFRYIHQVRDGVEYLREQCLASQKSPNPKLRELEEAVAKDPKFYLEFFRFLDPVWKAGFANAFRDEFKIVTGIAWDVFEYDMDYLCELLGLGLERWEFSAASDEIRRRVANGGDHEGS